MIDWVATSLTIAGFCVLALPGSRYDQLAYGVLLAGNITWILYAQVTGQLALGVINVLLAGISTLGIYTRR